MCNFFLGADLWANIVGGIVAALGFALLVYCWKQRKHRIMQDLIKIMGRAIEHRNIGEHKRFTDEKGWIQQAKVIENEATAKAKQLSPTAGSLFEWLNRVPPYDPTSERAKYISILSAVIDRIQGLMEHYS